MKKVLVLTYYWPPAGGPGVQRMLKFVKYLPLSGWQPVVLTVANGDYVARDESLLADVPPEITVYKVPAREWYSAYRKLTGKKENEAIPIGAFMKSAEDRWPERLAKWIRINVFVPDGKIGWIRPVLRKAREIVPAEDIRAIVSTSPPQSVQLAARKIAQKYRLPWVADFRDPWTESIFYQDLNRLKLMEKLDISFEKKVLQSVDTALTVSASIARRFREKTPGLRCEVIPNGFDKTDFALNSPPEPASKFYLSFVGNLKLNQNPPGLWQAIRDLLARDEHFAQNFQLRFTGKIDPEIEKSLGEFDLTAHTLIENYVPHDLAVRRMSESAALLYIIPEAPDNKGVLTGKLFEYLASGRPFLSIGPPDGDAAAILQETAAGPMFAPRDVAGISERLAELYRHWQQNDLDRLSPDPSKVEKYERKNQAQKLAEILDNLTGNQ